MAEVDDEIAVVGSDGVVENDPSNTPPIFERAPLKDRQPARRALVGHFNVEGERALGLGIALVENLRHDLVAKVQRLAFDPRLLRRDQKALELRRPRPFALRFAELGDLIQLPLRRLLIDALKDGAGDQQDRQGTAAPPCASIGRVPNLRVVDIVDVISAMVLLCYECRSAMRVRERSDLTICKLTY